MRLAEHGEAVVGELGPDEVVGLLVLQDKAVGGVVEGLSKYEHPCGLGVGGDSQFKA